ncbi:MAG TPA: serine acetyltransferase [Candidatus Choladousia intestinavium]|uniref:Serine acetyltransferase n=1 Tax=Candidatus Choladousia intestinavium TaxID=2840727 RepID=A0A9D1ACY7_9FIRM|nr:serine acetyltransferase [Candidatus Choladousia intestinavium]
MEKLVKAILESYEKYPETCSIAARNRLNKDLILEILEEIRYVIFPGFFEMKHLNREAVPYHVGELLEDIDYKLKKQVAKALYHKESKEELSEEEVQKEAEQIVTSFLNRIPALREILATDVQAAYEGDPAAFNTDEVIFSYPGVFAITVNRVAHELHRMGVPLIPRMMTEYAHNLTGIDIHPGAVIGSYFFIDHGTGVVVGETTEIGNHVKLYQGVTLGALSTRGGQSLRHTKRHPTLEDNVTVYSGASILGGETVIGEGATIGSNAFITSSVPGGTRVSIKNPELLFKGRERMAELGQEGFWKGNEE